MNKTTCYLVADFETTVYKEQQTTEVWAAACVEMFTEDVKIFNSIDQQFDYYLSINKNIICYYHNLKFDGSFWIDYLEKNSNFHQATYKEGETLKLKEKKYMENNEFIYSISGMGQWYSITVKHNNKYIEFRDSLKLLPFSVKQIGKSFKTKHQKSSIEYEGFRCAGCFISDEEKQYIANDVLVVKEALEIMFSEGHDSMTIGSCCLQEFKQAYGDEYNKFFPDIYQVEIDKDKYGCSNMGEYVRQSYRGGWCYVARGKEKMQHHNGFTIDVNSLYPSVMHSDLGYEYPYGKGTMWYGNFIPVVARYNHYYFVTVHTRFNIKKDMLPFIQVKNNWRYHFREMLTTSDVVYKGKKYDKVKNLEGKIETPYVTMTMTQTDWELFNKHYDLIDCTILHGCYFDSYCGFFDRYINKYRKIKMESTGAKRTLAKLFLNNLYGKMAANTDSSYRVAILKEDNSIGFVTMHENTKKPGYIPVGSAITSYARCFTITAAQENYYGPDKPGFIYADTDSIHCDIPKEKLKGVKLDPYAFGCWKMESEWDVGTFTRPKTYIEHVIIEDGKEVEPYYNVKCAGMPDKCKDLFIDNITDRRRDYDYTNDDEQFLSKKLTIDDFTIGLVVPGKLLPKRIPGGVVLVNTTYEMR